MKNKSLILNLTCLVLLIAMNILTLLFPSDFDLSPIITISMTAGSIIYFILMSIPALKKYNRWITILMFIYLVTISVILIFWLYLEILSFYWLLTLLTLLRLIFENKTILKVLRNISILILIVLTGLYTFYHTYEVYLEWQTLFYMLVAIINLIYCFLYIIHITKDNK